MAIGDLTAEEQVLSALLLAHATLVLPEPTQDERDEALDAIREAIKRVREAWNQ